MFQSETNVPVREVFHLDEDLKTSFFSPTKPQKPSSYDEVLRYQEIFQSGEINRGAKKFSERLSNNIHAEQQLKMSDIIQFPYLGEKHKELREVYKSQIEWDMKETPGGKPKIAPITHLSSVIGPYVATKVLYGSDEKFWDHVDYVNKRAGRDFGKDIVGEGVDFKTTVIRGAHLESGYSIMDYILSVTPFSLNRNENTVYFFIYVMWLEQDNHAIVYLPGWADTKMFPDVGAQYQRGQERTYSDKHCLFAYQLRAIPPIVRDSNTKYLEKHSDTNNNWRELKFRPWVDFSEDEHKNQMEF